MEALKNAAIAVGIAIALVLLFLLIAVTPAPAQSANCVPYQRAVDVLSGPGSEYHEALLHRGDMEAGGAAVTHEMWANPRTGTWTVLAVMNEDMACLVAQGTGFRFISLDDQPSTTPPGEDG